MNPFDSFDKIYYINLDDKTTRNVRLISEVSRMGIPRSKLQRMPGVIDKFQMLGKATAHLNCLLDFHENNYKNHCLILEDDFVFTHDQEKTHQLLNNFFDHDMHWNVLMFGSTIVKQQPTRLQFLSKIDEARTTIGYAVHNYYVPKMIQLYKNSITHLQKCVTAETRFHMDVYWAPLQATDAWYTMIPSIGYVAHECDEDVHNDPETPRIPLYTGENTKIHTKLIKLHKRNNPRKPLSSRELLAQSKIARILAMQANPVSTSKKSNDVLPVDIGSSPSHRPVAKTKALTYGVTELEFMNQYNTQQHELQNSDDGIKYFLAIKGCRARLDNAIKQNQDQLKNIDKYPIEYYHFVGDPTQSEEFVIDDTRKVVTLKCKDDYANVSHKSYLILKFVNKHYPNIIGMFQTDDDIKINLSNLYTMLEQNQYLNYYGNCITIKQPEFSFHIRDRPEEFEEYPLIKHHPIYIKPCTYCSGGGYYVHKSVFEVLLTKQRNLFTELPENLTRYVKLIDNKECFDNIPLIDDYNIGYVLYTNGITATSINIGNAVWWPGMHAPNN